MIKNQLYRINIIFGLMTILQYMYMNWSMVITIEHESKSKENKYGRHSMSFLQKKQTFRKLQRGKRETFGSYPINSASHVPPSLSELQAERSLQRHYWCSSPWPSEHFA